MLLLRLRVLELLSLALLIKDRDYNGGFHHDAQISQILLVNLIILYYEIRSNHSNLTDLGHFQIVIVRIVKQIKPVQAFVLSNKVIHLRIINWSLK